MPETELGRIIRLQVQRHPLKAKGMGYDPEPILPVDEASLDLNGMIGWHDGAWVLDAHHAAHPRARGGGRRALSLGFLGHYRAMADRFGACDLGCAGENIIVDSPRRVVAMDLAGDVIVHTAGGEVVLRDSRVAAPCAEFTSFLKGLDRVMPKHEQQADADFLDDGMRGYILAVEHLKRPVTIRVGDLVTVRGQ